jgi:hypothetical protein
MTTAAVKHEIAMRPWPPPVLSELESGERFVPEDRLPVFIHDTLLNEDSLLYNPEHLHLLTAEIGFLWTNVGYVKQMNPVAATAEIPRPPTTANTWGKARYKQQLRAWFGTDSLDFLITIDANYAMQASAAQFLALIEHELYHCGHKLDEFGSPKFTKEGAPVYGIRGHDVNEFLGVVRRYGASVVNNGLEFLDATKHRPMITEAVISEVCGTCVK